MQFPLVEVDPVMERKRLLVVDDDESLRTALRKVLEKAGYEVTLARDANEALQRLAERDHDLILTDYRMPGKTGLALAQEVIRLLPDRHPAVIVMTAFGDVLNYLEAMHLGIVQEYINKPVGRDELLVIIDSVLHGHGRRDRYGRSLPQPPA
jgi:DNA-binding NtrC family response regulator